MGLPAIDPRHAVLLDVSTETGIALLQLDQVRQAVEEAGLVHILEPLDKTQGTLRRLQTQILDMLAGQASAFPQSPGSDPILQNPSRPPHTGRNSEPAPRDHHPPGLRL
jgi:hypothetical protein